MVPEVRDAFGDLIRAFTNWQPFIPENTGVAGEFGWSGVFRAATIVFFAYIGFDAVSTAAGETKDPQRNMPIGLLGSLAVGWWACTATARHMGTADPSAVVWDEVIAFWLILWLITPASFWAQAGAFVLFRFFDAAKPGPVAWADKLFKIRRSQPIGWAQGFGIIFDDLVAALCTLMVIALWRAW